MAIGDPDELSILGANFTRNTANVGGAVSVNAVKESDREFKECLFELNIAIADGGGMYFFTSGGTDNVNSSRFNGNHAGDVAERRRVLRQGSDAFVKTFLIDVSPTAGGLPNTLYCSDTASDSHDLAIYNAYVSRH
ncbi:MAG: hypothetical protein ABJZ69_03765 [Hyphomicrobiales bacterium]